MSRHSLNVHTYFVMAIDNLILIRLTSNDTDYLPKVQSWQLNFQKFRGQSNHLSSFILLTSKQETMAGSGYVTPTRPPLGNRTLYKCHLYRYEHSPRQSRLLPAGLVHLVFGGGSVVSLLFVCVHLGAALLGLQFRQQGFRFLQSRL